MPRPRTLLAMFLCLPFCAWSEPGLPPVLPSSFKGLHKTVVSDYVPPPARGLPFVDVAFDFRTRLEEGASPSLQAFLESTQDVPVQDPGSLIFSLGKGDGGFDVFPLEYAYVALGQHDRFRAFLDAHGFTRLSTSELSRILYVGLDEESLGFYLSRFCFTSPELCLMVSNLLRHGDSDLALWLAERVGQILDPDGSYSTALAASGIEARDLPAFTRLLELLPKADKAALRELCLLRDFPEGMAPILDPEADNFQLLRDALALANSQFVDLLLPLYPRALMSGAAAASLVDALIVQGRPKNDYLYLLLLLGGYDEDGRYADIALEDILLSRDYRPALELGLRRSLSDLLIGRGANVNHFDPFYGPYLHWFASLSQARLAEKQEMLRYLISRGADRWARWQGLLYMEIPLTDKARINEKAVRLRRTPSLRGETITRLDLGTIVRVKEMGETELSIDDYTGLWYRVELAGGQQGWVYGKYLTYIE